MSRMIRSHRSPDAGSSSARSPIVSCQAGWESPSAAPKNWLTLRRATSANSSRRSYDDTRPCGPTARSSEQVRAPEPTPASTTSRPREDVGHRHDLGGVLRVDDGRAARHRDDELRQQRPEHEVLPAGGRGDREALLAADQLVVVEMAAVGEEPLARPPGRSCACGPCRRPGAPTRPTRSGPRCTPDQASAATSPGSRASGWLTIREPRRRLSRPRGPPLHVGGGEHAEDRAVRLDQEVLARRRPPDRVQQLRAGDRRPAAAVPPRASGSPSRPRPTAAGPRASPASRTRRRRPAGCRRRTTVTMLPAWASRARRIASASGRSSGTARVRRARSRATTSPSRRRIRAPAIACDAPVHRNTAITKKSTKSSRVVSYAGDALLDERPRAGPRRR